MSLESACIDEKRRSVFKPSSPGKCLKFEPGIGLWFRAFFFDFLGLLERADTDEGGEVEDSEGLELLPEAKEDDDGSGLMSVGDWEGLNVNSRDA